MTKIHGRPDNQDEWLDDTIGKGKGDFDLPSGGRWVGVDKAIVDFSIDNPHWSKMPEPVSKASDFPSWYDSDNDARSPLEADLEDNNL